MWVQVKLIVMTIILTGLIWAYADQAVKETETLVLAANITPGRGLIPKIIEPPRGSFTVEVYGSAKNIARAKEDAEDNRLLDLNIPLADLEFGIHKIDLASRLRQSRILTERKLAMVSISPATLVVDIDKLVRREVQLEPVRPIDTQFVEPPRFTPPSVTVEYPLSRQKELNLEEGIRIGIAEYIEDQLAGKPLKIQVPMRTTLGDDIPIECFPKEVTLRLTLQSSLVEETLSDSIPVRFQALPGAFGKYVPELKEGQAFDRPKLRGPREVLTALKPEQIDAYVLLTLDDVQESIKNPDKWHSRPVQYRFPWPDISLVGSPTIVDFRLKPTAATTDNE